MNRLLLLLIVLVYLGGGGPKLSADDAARQSKLPGGGVNLKLPTGGGKQFWSDELLFYQWRIQRNAWTGHCRLLDRHNVRHAWGDFEHCRQQLEAIKRRKGLRPMSGKAVIVLHGLGRTRRSMAGLCDYLRRHGDWLVFNVSYASTRRDLAAHARSLAHILEHLDGIEQIDFVAHSLGNLVIRRYLADQTDPASGRRPDPRIHRFVMLAPPNHGAQLAARFRNNPLFSLVWGKSGDQLAAPWDESDRHLATPQCPFGIIAGGKGRGDGANPWLQGDDDWIVRVEETRLAGARDFVVVPALHMFIMDNDRVKQYTLCFLKHGYFLAEDRRQPIEAEPSRPADCP